MSLLIRDPYVDGRPTSVFVEDGKIAALGEARPADRTIDGAGLYAFPSLKNGHTHAAMVILRGYGDDMPLMEWLQTKIWPAELELSEEDVYHGTRLALLEMIRSGTTYLQDMYWHRDGVARAVRDMGVRGHISSVFIDLGDPDRALEQRERIEPRLAEREKYGPRVSMALGPHAIYTVSPASLEWVAEVSEREDLLVHIHLAETQKEVEDCVREHGLRPAELLQKLGLMNDRLVAAHGVWLDRAERELLAEAGATVVTNPVSNLKLAVGDIFSYRDAQEAGLRVVLGTDGAASNNNLDLFEEMKVAALVQKHKSGDPTCLPAREALALATTESSKAFRLGPGGIEEGAAADLMLVDLSDAQTQPVHDPVSNLVYAANGRCVHTTICDGEVLMYDRNLEVADEAEILEAGARTARDLIARVAAAAPVLLLVFVSLVLSGCERFGVEANDQIDAIDPEVAERVLDEVLARLDAAREEDPTEFVARLPAIKEEVARREGFDRGWSEFKLSVQATDPDLEIRISNRVTAHILELLGPAEEE